MTTTDFIEYGSTYNLGDYENEKISIRVQVGPDETPEAACARARAFVEGTHAETVARRKRASAIAYAQSRISDLDQWLPRDRTQAESAGLTITWIAPPRPSSDDALILLEYDVAVREAEKKAVSAALRAHQEAKWAAEREQREREQAERNAAMAYDPDPEVDDDQDDEDDDPDNDE